MLSQTTINKNFDFWSSDKIYGVEFSDDSKVAILTIPLIHVGPNKKGLFWTPEMLKQVAPMFNGVTFRYDLDGQEGSSHTINKLSSPHFDVGWTYSENGAWYDDSTRTLWVKGEVTHPQVIEKLSRVTSDGHRELNYASMGVIVEKAICSICGGKFEEVCENGHQRLQVYEGEVCNKIPVEVSKALHAALTNDPADGEAEIKECVFQEFEYSEANKMFEDKKKENPFANKTPSTPPMDHKGMSSPFNKANESQISPNDMKNSPNTNMVSQGVDKGPLSTMSGQMPGGLATSSPSTGQPGTALSPELILKDLAERIKTIENKLVENISSEPQPELINAAPQDQFTQDNMGTTTSFEQEAKGMIPSGQNTQEKAPLNPAKEMKSEKADMGGVVTSDPMTRVMEMLEEIMKRLPAVSNVTESADGEGTEEMINLNKGKAKSDEDEKDAMGGHMAPGEPASGVDPGNAKNKANMLDPGKVATADSKLESIEKELKMLKQKLEIQDNEVPEFGGSNSVKGLDVADMGARQRAENYGDFGKWDAIFHGANSASKFKR